MNVMRLKQVRERAREIRAEFEALMQSRILAVRKDARQWRFFHLCFESTLAGMPAKWPADGPQQLAQLKFEVEDKLRQYYRHVTRPVKFLFSLRHRRDAIKDRLIAEPDYPEIAGYCMLVRETRAGEAPASTAERVAYLERVVADCIDAEFAAYRRLPGIDEEAVLASVQRGGPLHGELMRTLTESSRLALVVSNDFNPSTKQLCFVKVEKLSDREAEVLTKEYRYLRWWNQTAKTYAQREQGTVRYRYRLVRTDSGWKASDRVREKRGEPRRLLWDNE